MRTISISIPTRMYEDAKKLMAERGCGTLSKFVQEALRKNIYPQITENGFTPEFEEMVLKGSKEPIEDDIVLETEEDIINYYKYLKVPKQHLHDQNKKYRHI